MSEAPLREIAAVFGIQFDSAALDRGNEAIGRVTNALHTLAAGIAGGAVFAAVRGFVDQFEEMGSAINDASDRLGIGSQALQELQFAFGQAGVRGEQVNAALSNLSVRLEQARTGAGPAAAAMRALGVRATDAAGHVRPVNDVIADVADRMSGIEDPARRVQISMALFGGVGRRLVGVLHSGAGGLADMRQQFEELGGGITEDGVTAADDYGDALGRWQVSSRALQSGIATRLLPVLTKITDWISHGVAVFTRMTRGTNVVAVAMAALGGVLALEVLPPLIATIAPFAAMAAGIAAAVLIVDDLIAMFRGGNSVIGRFIDRIFGIGSAKRVVTELTRVWQRMTDGFNLTITDIRGWWAGFMVDLGEFRRDLDELTSGGFTNWLQNFNPASLTEAWGGFTLAIRSALEALGILQHMTAHGTDPGTMSEADTQAAERRVMENSARNFEAQRARIVASGGTAEGWGRGASEVQAPLAPLHIEMHVHTTAPAHEVARHAVGMIQQRLANQHDANHPLPPRE